MTDGSLAVQYAATADDSPAAIIEARKKSHDALIERLGDHRKSGVTWYQFPAPRALALLEQVGDLDQDLRAWLLAHPKGILVCATADSDIAPGVLLP